MIIPADEKEQLKELQNLPLNKKVPPLWLFIICLPICVSCFIWMGYASVSFSNFFLRNARFNGIPMKLEQGWLWGRKMDLTDPQWQMFRNFIPLLTVTAIIHLGLSLFVKNYLCQKSKTPLLIFNVCLSLGFMLYLYGISLIFPLMAIIINYIIARLFGGSKLNILFSWLFNSFILFSSKYYLGYRFLEILGIHYLWLDDYRGIMSWEIYFNLTFCRLISFNMDYRDAKIANEKDHHQVEINPEWNEIRKRMTMHHNPESDYGILAYLSYVLYLPLFIAGPMLSYNAFYSYIQAPQRENSLRNKIIITLQVIFYTIALEIAIHYIYSAGFNDKGFWKERRETPLTYSLIPEMSPTMVLATGLLTLLYMYLKFLIIWRFFRAWALWDGINAPENMTHCIINNTTVSGFWRSWHSSLNIWIVKYIYVPMGGSKRKFLSVWLIFGFIALWHDLMWRWLAWAFLNCLLFLGEIFVENVIAQTDVIQHLKQISDHRFKPYYNILTASVSTITMFGMVIANLAIMHGFMDSFAFIKRVYWNDDGIFMFLASFILAFTTAEVVLWNRERRKVIKR
jgi:D-alanyl-lipoteichoic acid acyltransferase DltB (MBOAT superfamily)